MTTEVNALPGAPEPPGPPQPPDAPTPLPPSVQEPRPPEPAAAPAQAEPAEPKPPRPPRPPRPPKPPRPPRPPKPPPPPPPPPSGGSDNPASVAAARSLPIGKQIGVTRRTSFEVTRSVWMALLLRESLTRLFSSRGAWFWLLAEPTFHIAYMMVIFTVVRIRHIGGIETAAWIMIGILSFLAFRRTASQSMQAVNSNHALFTYRQVKPIDAVLTRALLEGVLLVVVSGIVIATAIFFGVDAVPDDPLAVMSVFLGMWLLAVGFSLAMSIVVELASEIGKVVGFVMTPLYFISGVIFPIASVPPPYRDWVMLNPLAHGVEAARKGFAEHYHGAPETSIAYIYGFALVLLFLGLALHRVFARKLVTR